MRAPSNNDRNDDDLGFDDGVTKLALSRWLLQHGTAEAGDLGAFIAAYRRLKNRKPETDEALALALAAAHSIRHEVSGLTRNDEGAGDRAWCSARPCKVMAVSRCLLVLVQQNNSRSGYRVELLKALTEITQALNNALPSLNSSVRAMQDCQLKPHAAHELAFAAALQRGTGDPLEVVTSRFKNGALGDGIDALELERLNAVSSMDVLMASLYGNRLQKLVEGIQVLCELAAELQSVLQQVGTGSVRSDKRRGRPSYELLNRIRWCLRRGGFLPLQIVSLAPDSAFNHERQREQAVKRVKQGIRAAQQLPRTWDDPP